MIKIYFKRFLLLLLPVIFISVVSCNKAEKEQRIIGIWKRVNIPFPNSQAIEEWHFSVNKIYVVNKAAGVTDTTDIAIYQIKVGVSKTTITAMEFDYDGFNTTWNVIEYTDDVLAIHGYKERNFQYLEFTKIR